MPDHTDTTQDVTPPLPQGDAPPTSPLPGRTLPEPVEGQGEGSAPSLEHLQASIATLSADLETERTAHQTIRDELAAASQQTEQLHAALSDAAGRYRNALLAANPTIPPELVTGDTIEAVDTSLESAKAVVQSVIARNVAQAPPPASPPVPAGAPVRTGPDTSAMSATEKIRCALETEGRR